MNTQRSRFEGLWNILRFNWHFYALAAAVVAGGIVIGIGLGGRWGMLVLIATVAALFQVALSLAVSHWIYDRSDLYALPFLDGIQPDAVGKVVNIHAGFDETSSILKTRFGEERVLVWDFYHPEKHREISIRRARRASPPRPEQISVDTSRLPLGDGEAGLVCLILSAHEIRDRAEQEQFFTELRRILAPGGRLCVVEHLRDPANALAFSLGVFHFFSRPRWAGLIEGNGFALRSEEKITPFVSAFLAGAEAEV